MKKLALLLPLLALAAAARAEETNAPSAYAAFERRLDAARERYATDLPVRIPGEGQRLVGLLRDTLPAPVRSRILAFAETNHLDVLPSFVVSAEGRTNDLWVGASLTILPEGTNVAFGRDVVFRLHSRTATSYPDYGEDFETYALKSGADFVDGAWQWDHPSIRLADWAAYPKANITWCGIDLWEIEHADFRDGLLRKIPFEEAFSRLSFPPPPEHPVSRSTSEAFALAVQTITNRLAAVDMDVLAEEARQVSQHVPGDGIRLPPPGDGIRLPPPESWLVPFKDALGPVCDEMLFELTSVRRTVESGTEYVQPALSATVRIGETWCALLFFPFDCKPERIGVIETTPGTIGAPASTALWASPFLLISPTGRFHHVFW